MSLIETVPLMLPKIWGGNRLGPGIGESWNISTHHEGKSIKDPAINLNYLVKLIDTSDHLSVQVHPGDEYAKQVENSSGKTECWLILDSDPGAGIYLGFKKGVTKREFQTAIANNLDASTFLNFYPVSRGDFFFVPAGSVHAIGKGVFLAEVQQSSGITYRVWDWNRVGDDGKPRQLHVQKAMDVLNFSDSFNKELKSAQKKGLFESAEDVHLCNHQQFDFQLLHLDGDRELKMPKHSSLMTLDSGVLLNGKSISQFDSFLALEKSVVALHSSALTKLLFISGCAKQF